MAEEYEEAARNASGGSSDVSTGADSDISRESPFEGETLDFGSDNGPNSSDDP